MHNTKCKFYTLSHLTRPGNTYSKILLETAENYERQKLVRNRVGLELERLCISDLLYDDGN